MHSSTIKGLNWLMCKRLFKGRISYSHSYILVTWKASLCTMHTHTYMNIHNLTEVALEVVPYLYLNPWDSLYAFHVSIDQLKPLNTFLSHPATHLKAHFAKHHLCKQQYTQTPLNVHFNGKVIRTCSLSAFY